MLSVNHGGGMQKGLQWRSLTMKMGGRKRIYPKFSIEPRVENVYTQKNLYENYIYNTTERKVRRVGRPSRPLLSYALERENIWFDGKRHDFTC
ncbi:hypothetical protein Hanom_Chr07g00585961 [Helianthus anomalus]